MKEGCTFFTNKYDSLKKHMVTHKIEENNGTNTSIDSDDKIIQVSDGYELPDDKDNACSLLTETDNTLKHKSEFEEKLKLLTFNNNKCYGNMLTKDDEDISVVGDLSNLNLSDANLSKSGYYEAELNFKLLTFDGVKGGSLETYADLKPIKKGNN